MELSTFSRVTRASKSSTGRAAPLLKTWNDISCALTDAAKKLDPSVIELVLESIAMKRNKESWLIHSTIILRTVGLLYDVKSNQLLCEKAFEALNTFDYLYQAQHIVRRVCDGLVCALRERINMDYKLANELEYVTNFMDDIPDQLIGHQGIWRIIFSYHYCALADNFEVIMKGFMIVNSIAHDHPITLAVSGIAPVLIEAGTAFIDRVDFAELGSEIMSHLVRIDWQDSLTSDRNRLVRAGICEYCMCIMNKFMHNTRVTCGCLYVIHNLSQCSNSAMQIKLREVGAIEGIMTAINSNCLVSNHFNISIALSAIMATNALTDWCGNDLTVIRDTVDIFVRLGMCEVLLDLLEKYSPDAEIKYDWIEDEVSDEESLLDHGQSVIRNLAYGNPVYRKRLAKLGAGNWLPELF